MAELIVFDCDGVLVDSEMIASRELAAYLAEQGVDLAPEEARQRFTGCSLATVHEKIQTENGVILPATFEEDLRRRDRAAFDRELKAIPGIHALLEQLPLAKCVASSGSPEKINHSLKLTGLDGFFGQNLFSARMVTHGKPAPDLFLFAAHRMGVAPKDSLVIEDSPVGIEAARAAGMTAVGFIGGSHCGKNYGQRLEAAGARTICATMEDVAAFLSL